MSSKSTGSGVSNMSSQTSVAKSKKGACIIIGPKGAGKTVFFVSAVDLLQRSIQEKDTLDKKLHRVLKKIEHVEYLNRKTADFIRKTVGSLKQQAWPAETAPSQAGNDHYEVLIKYKRLGFWPHLERLILLDYPGGVFTKFFAKEDSDPTESAQYDDGVSELEKNIASSRRIFVLLDSVDIYNGGSELIVHCLFKFIDVIREKNVSKSRIAVLFTKSDLIVDQTFCPESKLKKCYPNEWGRLNSAGVKFFKVSAVRKTEMNKDGVRVPVRGFSTSQSHGIIEPLIWVLGF